MAALSPEPREWQLDPHLEVPRAPRGEAGATPPLPQPATPGRPDPARRLGAAAPGPGRSGRGSQPRAPGRGRAAPSPAPARRSRGRSSRQRPTGRSTGCSARSWCADPGARAARGAAAGGAGARTDRAGHRRSVPLGGAITSSPGRGRSREAGRGDPTLRWPRGGEGAIVPPSARPSPLAPRPHALQPARPGCLQYGMRNRGPAKGAIAGTVGWGGDPWAGEDNPASPLAAPLTDPEQAETLN